LSPTASSSQAHAQDIWRQPLSNISLQEQLSAPARSYTLAKMDVWLSQGAYMVNRALIGIEGAGARRYGRMRRCLRLRNVAENDRAAFETAFFLRYPFWK